MCLDSGLKKGMSHGLVLGHVAVRALCVLHAPLSHGLCLVPSRPSTMLGVLQVSHMMMAQGFASRFTAHAFGVRTAVALHVVHTSLAAESTSE